MPLGWFNAPNKVEIDMNKAFANHFQNIKYIPLAKWNNISPTAIFLKQGVPFPFEKATKIGGQKGRFVRSRPNLTRNMNINGKTMGHNLWIV